MHGDRIFFHDVLDLRNRRAGNHFLERKYPAQPFVVVHHVHIIDLIHFFCLDTHFAKTFGHTPVFVNDHHFRTHETAGRIFVVFQQVNNVTGLFDVLNVRKYFLLFVFVHFPDDVYGIVRIHVVYKTFGNGFRRKKFQKTLSYVFVHFNEHVGCRFIV